MNIRESINLIREYNGEIVVPRARDNDFNYVFLDNKAMCKISLSNGLREFFWLHLKLPNPIAVKHLEVFEDFDNEYSINKLFNWLIEYAKSKNYKSIFMELTGSESIHLVSLYENFGFVKYEQTKDNNNYFYLIF